MGRKQDSLHGVRFVRFQRDHLGQKALLSLAVWLAVAACLALVFWHPASDAAGGLFQSDLPTPAEWPTSTATADAPTETPLPTTSPVLTATVPVTDATATSTQAPAPEPTQMPSATATSVPPATPEPATAATVVQSGEAGPRYPDEEAGIKFHWRTLVDALALGASYVWLACGVGVFLLVVILLLRALVHRRRSTPGR